MTESDFNFVLSGALVLASTLSGLYFVRFWREARDRLFLAFAIAFFLMAINWIALTLVNTDNENRPLLYGIRLVAFLVIIVGIWDKNRRA